MPKTKVKEKNN